MAWGQDRRLFNWARPKTTLDRTDLIRRVASPLSSVPRPFLRWAGSKQRLLGEIVAALPERYGTYYEPFLGGGSLFFLLRPARAVLSDKCQELVDTFSAVRDGPQHVLRVLARLDPMSEHMYYEIRASRSKGPYARAAHFIYLNRAGWNGLYRVNSKGEFNVPYGAPKSAGLVDAENLKACSALLRERGVSLGCIDFVDALQTVRRGDLVFLDPPYVTGHNNNGFIDYNERLFSWNDQVRLAELSRRLIRKGAAVIVTNAYHDAVLDLYPNFDVQPIDRLSTLAGDKTRRGMVREAILWRDGGSSPGARRP